MLGTDGAMKEVAFSMSITVHALPCSDTRCALHVYSRVYWASVSEKQHGKEEQQKNHAALFGLRATLIFPPLSLSSVDSVMPAVSEGKVSECPRYPTEEDVHRFREVGKCK